MPIPGLLTVLETPWSRATVVNAINSRARWEGRPLPAHFEPVLRIVRRVGWGVGSGERGAGTAWESRLGC